MRRSLVICALAAAAVGCARRGPLPGAHAPRPSSAVVRVQDRWLPLHLSVPAPPGADTLVLYVTGDGGWRGRDLDTYRHITGWGEPTAGFSAPDYLDNLRGDAESLPPRALARDFVEIAGGARAALGLHAASPVVLVGVSRGADLAVIAAADPIWHGTMAGVLAVALTDEEEYVRRPPRGLVHREDAGPRGSGEIALEIVRPYDCLARITAPVALIQSTHDEYVPAAQALEQFGPVSARRRFSAIASRDHSFSDVRSILYRTMRTSFEWLLSVPRTSS